MKTSREFNWTKTVKHPWMPLARVKVGDEVEGKVVVIADCGAIEVAEGLRPYSRFEMSWSTHLDPLKTLEYWRCCQD